ncbi:MAG: hypothetical protein R2991_16565 [Thermoanaerobaculia bacterium]
MSRIERFYTARGDVRYRIVLEHDGLLRRQEIKGDDAEQVQMQASLKAQQWNQQWAQRVATAEQRADRQAAARNKATKLALAQQLTQEAEEQWSALAAVLAGTLHVDDAIDWSAMEDHSPYEERMPAAPLSVVEPDALAVPAEPELLASEPPGCFGAFLDMLQPWRVAERQRVLDVQREEQRRDWLDACDDLRVQHERAVELVHRQNRDALERYKSAVARWTTHREEFSHASVSTTPRSQYAAKPTSPATPTRYARTATRFSTDPRIRTGTTRTGCWSTGRTRTWWWSSTNCRRPTGCLA